MLIYHIIHNSCTAFFLCGLGQCVEHMVEFKMNEDEGESRASHYKINARDFFVPTQVKLH